MSVIHCGPVAVDTPSFLACRGPRYRVGRGPELPALSGAVTPWLTPEFRRIMDAYPGSARLARLFHRRMLCSMAGVVLSGVAMAVGGLAYLWLGWTSYLAAGLTCVALTVGINYLTFQAFLRMVRSYRDACSNAPAPVFKRHLITEEAVIEIE